MDNNPITARRLHGCPKGQETLGELTYSRPPLKRGGDVGSGGGGDYFAPLAPMASKMDR